MSIFSLHSRRSFKPGITTGKHPKGFTIIELVVVVALIVIITATLMVRQARFDSSTLLRSLSYSIALTLRSAQVYGTSVRVASGSSGAPAYGVYFNNANNYLLFADNNGNGVYEPAIDTVVQTYQLGSGFQISKFCGKLATGVLHCSSDPSDAGPISWLVVYFKRPNPDALFTSSAGESYSGAYIQISAVNDVTNTHSITVSSTGEIAVGTAGS